jgi:Fungal Zn(2)-Cys(6) binuclear cluster domain
MVKGVILGWSLAIGCCIIRKVSTCSCLTLRIHPPPCLGFFCEDTSLTRFITCVTSGQYKALILVASVGAEPSSRAKFLPSKVRWASLHEMQPKFVVSRSMRRLLPYYPVSRPSIASTQPPHTPYGFQGATLQIHIPHHFHYSTNNRFSIVFAFSSSILFSPVSIPAEGPARSCTPPACINCRTLHHSCSETKPSCSRCLRSERPLVLLHTGSSSYINHTIEYR